MDVARSSSIGHSSPSRAGESPGSASVRAVAASGLREGFGAMVPDGDRHDEGVRKEAGSLDPEVDLTGPPLHLRHLGETGILRKDGRRRCASPPGKHGSCDT